MCLLYMSLLLAELWLGGQRACRAVVCENQGNHLVALFKNGEARRVMTKPKPLFSFGHIYRSNRKTLPLWDFACPGTCLECGIQLGNIKGD